MKVAVFNTKPFDRRFLEGANRDFNHELKFFETRLVPETADLAGGYPAVSAFVDDELDAEVIGRLAEGGTRVIALRATGYNNVDLGAAAERGITVVRVPAYSPHAVAEHAVGLMLALNRKVYRAYSRTRDNNFDITGLMGFDMNGRTAGIVGTGTIGETVARILHGFGCRLLAFDIQTSEECKKLGVEYVELDRLLGESDIITLHTPLNPKTKHMIDAEAVGKMKQGVMLINTSRGGVVDTDAVIDGLKSRTIGSFGMDVYEDEGGVFFRNLSGEVLDDDRLAQLLIYPNVIVTSHQAFFTEDAVASIAETTLSNIRDVEQGRECPNEVKPR